MNLKEDVDSVLGKLNAVMDHMDDDESREAISLSIALRKNLQLISNDTQMVHQLLMELKLLMSRFQIEEKEG